MTITVIVEWNSLRILKTRGNLMRLFKKVFHCVGGVVSPLLMNIVLNELDRSIEDELIPEYTKGKQRKPNSEYKKLASAAYRAAR